MNADPDEGQPTTVPETTLPEAGADEGADAADEVSEAPVAEADAGSESESAEPEAESVAAESEPEAASAETASEPDAPSAESESAEADAAETGVGAEDEAESSELKSAEAEAPGEPEPAATPAPASTTPLVAGRYRLVSEIGGGAMGVVWRARDEVLGRDVAVKELRPDHGMSGAQVRVSHQRARREGRIAARLQHPNAVVIYDVAEHDGRPYLIMEYVPSQSLGDILATGAVLTPAEVARIGAQLASALTAAHERGIVHRDIKPGNVLMTTDGTVKLTDFGISRAAGDATVTATGEILGTPAYTAPEVAQGHPVAFPADVFSLGATLYAAVEGTPPFGEDVNAMALLLRVVRNEIRQPKRSGPLTDTIMWMLSPEPADRPTMKEVWQGLDRLSSKPLPVADIRALAPQTRPFAAPSPTLVVDTAGLKGVKAGPEPASEPLPAAAAPSAASTPLPAPTQAPTSTPTPAPIPSRTPSPISSQVTAPPATPAGTSTLDSSPGSTTNSAALQAATPTSAMVPTPTRETSLAKSAAAKAPASTPPPTSGHPAVSPTSPPPERRSRSRMPLAIAICAVGTAVLIVAIVIAMNSGSKDKSPTQPVAHGSTTPTHSNSSAAKPPTSSSNTAPSSQPSTTPSSSTSTTPSSSSTSSSPSSPSSPSTSAGSLPSDPAAFITNYYSLLPGNLNAAYPQMTTAYQNNVAGGFSGYQQFWDGIQSVSVSGVSASDVSATGSTVVATIHYVDKNGTTSTERTSFGLVKDGNSWKINTSHVIG